jgi:hypothetical protein
MEEVSTVNLITVAIVPFATVAATKWHRENVASRARIA